MKTSQWLILWEELEKEGVLIFLMDKVRICLMFTDGGKDYLHINVFPIHVQAFSADIS